jgi:hypothetical protein
MACRPRISFGPLFRVMNRHGQVLDERLSGAGVAIVVKRYVEKLGYDPALFAGHSLPCRAGDLGRRPSQRHHRPPLYPGRRSVPRERGQRPGALKRMFTPDGLR